MGVHSVEFIAAHDCDLALSLPASSIWCRRYWRSTLLPDRGRWLSSLQPGQGVATVGLLLYALLVSPLVPHDGLGTFLSGVMIVRYPRAGPVKEGSGSASFSLASPGLGITGSTMCDGRASS